MTTAMLTIARGELSECIDQFNAGNDCLDAQFAESLAALEAYQSHLDAWHKELAAERAALEQERAALVGGNTDDAGQIDAVNNELKMMRSLLERQAGLVDSVSHPNPTPKPADVVAEPKPRPKSSGDPVIGSVVAQFDKLRKQQAQARTQPKKRH